jgi:hypothetical protein
MNKRPFFSALILVASASVPLMLITAALPTSSTGINSNGHNGDNVGQGNPGTPQRANEQPATSNTATVPPTDSVIDAAKPNDLPVKNPEPTTRTSTDNPSAKIFFGHVESVDKSKHTARIKDRQGKISDVKFNDKATYGKKSHKPSNFSDVKAGDDLNYSLGSGGQADQINWNSQKVQ